MSSSEKLTIHCQDGYSLSARYYPHQTELKQVLPVLICPATGITKQFYNSYATWLSQQGYDVLVFDFRGIGESLHSPLKESTASIVQWGQLDIPAAIDALISKTQADNY